MIRTITTRSQVHTKSLLLSLLFSFSTGLSFASDRQLWEIPLEELVQTRISTLASGTATPLEKAAAVMTVITEEDIVAMGATDIDQVLETVPGLHVGTSDQGYAPKYNIRGITSGLNAQTLMLINGVPVTNLVFGNRGNVWAGMPVKSISRIEVIRGPGSAMHGADAFAGVINIITKSRKDINGTVTGYRQGSFDTHAAWMEHGQSINGIDIGLVLELETTDGHNEMVTADVLGLSGPVSTMRDSIDARLDMNFDQFRLRLGYQDRSNVGTGVGVLPILDPDGRFANQRFNADFTYTENNLAPDLQLETRISYYRDTQEVEENIILAPAGAFPGFPDGFIGNPGFKEEQARLDISAIYEGVRQHILRLGAGFYWGDVFETTETKNFFPDNSPRPGIEDVSDTPEVWLPEKDRTNHYVFLQDEWQFKEDWLLTTGVRFDHYSDFGDTTNPRIALVWATSDSITTKLLYGRAFRAPSITELFVTSNPVNLGNSNLKPETIDTYELAFSHQFASSLIYTANTYYYKIKDLITLIPNGQIKQSQNVNDRTGYGVEFEMIYKASPTLRVLANYAYQHAEDDTTNKDVGDAPEHQLYARAEWRLADNWLISPQVNWVGEQKRSPEDTTRSENVPHYTTVDMTIKQLNIVPDLDMTLSIHNLFDRKVIEPSPISPLPFGGPASDLPSAGRSIHAEISYQF